MTQMKNLCSDYYPTKISDVNDLVSQISLHYLLCDCRIIHNHHSCSYTYVLLIFQIIGRTTLAFTPLHTRKVALFV